MIGGREVRTGHVREQREPHLRERVCATWHAGGAGEAVQAIDAALVARHDWSSASLEDRAAVLIRAADLISAPHMEAGFTATMLGQGKTVREAEIDAAAELADFWRFNVWFAEQMDAVQPISPAGFRNSLEQRALEGFVYAVTPFNFTAIGGNLPTAPALMGNTVVWKPSQTAILSNWYVFQILREAGLPDGVINFLPGDPEPITEVCIDHREFAGVHFTGSSDVFRSLYRKVGERIDRYRSLPRSVGRRAARILSSCTPRADPQAVAVALVRGSFEYQGQKCSAASRAYVLTRSGRRCAIARSRSWARSGRANRPTRRRSWAPSSTSARSSACAFGVRARARLRARAHPVRRRGRRQRRLVRRSDHHRDRRPALRHHGARAVRAMPRPCSRVSRGGLFRDV